jgi:serine/threonine protein kinase
MSPERCQQVHALFDAALQCEPAHRPGLLAQRCGVDVELRAEVERLLAADAEARQRGFLEGSGPRTEAVGVAGSGPAPGLPAPPDYEILGELGRGGMGVVYKARQVKVNRLVALKMIPTGVHATPEQLTRFRREAEAVARLDHPHIVHLYDYGDVDGRPYFSMELVEGGTLAQRIAGHSQPTRESAALVETLARAIHYAHGRGIVHRDLKPANVLLQRTEGRVRRPEGRSQRAVVRGQWVDRPPGPSDLCPLTSDLWPKITDFGLAKRLDAEADQTRSGILMGTPRYMAPEQAARQARNIGPATDVHALGVILYELLTGQPPFGAETPLQTLDQVVNQEPRPMSQLQPRLPRDLQTICLKCLQKKASERYASALDLAEDLLRWRSGEPIRARPVGPVESLWRWSRRNPLVAGSLGALVLVLFTALALITWQWRRAEANFQQSEENFAQARDARQAELNAVLTELHPRSGMLPISRGLLTQAVARRRRSLEGQRTDPRLQYDLGYACLELGIVASEIGKVEEALQLYQEASLLLQTPVRETAQNDSRLHLGATYFYRARAHSALGQMNDALQWHRQAEAVWQGLAGEDPTSIRPARNLALNSWGMAQVYLWRGQLAEARSHFERAAAIGKQLAQNHPEDDNLGYHRAYHLHGMGQLYLAAGRPADALGSLREAHELRRHLVEQAPYDIWARFDLARTEFKQGTAYRALEQDEEALRCWRAARKTLEGLLHDNAFVIDFQSEYAELLVSIGRHRRESKRYPEALSDLERARDICVKLQADHPAVVRSQALLAESCLEVGLVRAAQSQPAESLQSLRQATEAWDKLRFAHPDIARSRSGRAEVYRAIGDLHAAAGQPPAARPCYEQARQLQEQLVRECPDVPAFRKNLERTRQRIERLR